MPKNSQFNVVRDVNNSMRVTFNNPPINLVDPETILEFGALIDRIEADAELKVVVFDSAVPEFFLARYDMRRAAELPSQPGPSGLPAWPDFTTRLSRAPVISVASIRGRARGIGNEFLLACDLRFASLEKAIFGQPEVAVGVVPGGGALERLPLLVGRARALEIVLGSDDFDAATAEQYGWVNRAIPDAELDKFVDNFVRRVSSFDRQALSEAKRLVSRAGLPTPSDLVASQSVFLSAIGWPGARERAVKLVGRGARERGDFELRLGHHVGDLT
jgi:enoyl-CoA hydratase/carnithine racemase